MCHDVTCGRQVDRMKRVDEYQRDVVMMSKINESDQRTEKLKKDKVISRLSRCIDSFFVTLFLFASAPHAVPSGRASRAAHGDQAQQRDGATESHSEYGKNEEGAWAQGVTL
jgi:hypothetical protein